MLEINIIATMKWLQLILNSEILIKLLNSLLNNNDKLIIENVLRCSFKKYIV